ncbi:MAG: Mannosylglycerate hydrolase [Chloroflexi bacterium ADurb.Bin325]|nr:MAG: Mannosylglycerate hydrolase [Chloroflexi bacterium ADurb.Bin325]
MPDFIPYTRRQLDAVLEHLASAIYTPVAPLEIAAWRTREPVPYAQRQSGEPLQPVIGESWGTLFDCAWFRFTGVIPPAAAGQTVVLLLDVNGEMCVFDAAGEPVRGLTNLSSTYDFSLGRPGKRVLPLASPAAGGEQVEVWADVGANDLFGNLQENGAVREATIAICNEAVRDLYYDFEVLLDALKVLPPTSARHAQILVALNDAAHACWNGITAESLAAARAALAEVLSKRGGDPSLSVSAIGHAHMDLGWLWPIRETKRKGARTFSTALANLERYPDYVFAASQAQYFQWMKEEYPGLYARIRAGVAAGRIEPQGALWVECDTNVTGGESLIRQILYGRRFFQAEFGVDPRYIWLPDAFGYTAALPGIMARAGLHTFCTQKLSWSLINKFPHQSFWWEGVDGSRVLVHMLPEETYNSPAAPRSLARIEENYRDKGVSDMALMVYGIGDGGGGPGEEHLERLARLHNFAGLPPVEQEWSAAFFERWAKDAARFAAWRGELYLERHQGTYTTEAANKRYNRRLEEGLRAWELWASLAQATAGAAYPHERLTAIWHEVLLYQFHDILPGSSIKRVYDESVARYALLLAEVEAGIQAAQGVLAGASAGPAADAAFIVFNPLSWPRSEWVRAGDAWQRVTIPALGYGVVHAGPAAEPIPALRASAEALENDLLRVTFAPDGAIASIQDKTTGREAVAPGQAANRFVVYRDYGDAWDFPMDYAESAPASLELAGSEPFVDGPRAVVRRTYRIGHSELVQEVSLTAGQPYLVFDTRVRWLEPMTMLRVQFPVDIRALEATHEIQFGHIRRPTHRNTTWDLALDEVPSHKWVDLSERDYGVALLNDCKYGHRVKDNVLDLNLIRSVPYPGPRLVADSDVAPGQPHHAYTDQGEHTFRYALYPHAGDPIAAGVVQAAYAFNQPLRADRLSAMPAAPSGSFMQPTPDTVIVEAVKRAEDGKDLIVRLYESAGQRTRARLTIGLPLTEVVETDLMEVPLEEQDGVTLDGDAIHLDLRPFDIRTLRLRM